MTAIRATVQGRVQGVGFREATVARAHALGVLGWVRNDDDGAVRVHAEGSDDAVAAFEAFLRAGPAATRVDGVVVERVKVEGHEQFAVRGVPAGAFAVRALARGWELQLEVDGGVRAWTVPKGPSMDPAEKRFAVEATSPTADDGAPAWDRGSYEQGGRVPWPEALHRGHAVFVLHGERLRGGFALQRTRGGAGASAQWLLVKRKDEHARPGSDVVAESRGAG
ncbi:MAG TPA: acylphosphatase [Conexibacter sp.]|nr:acylphosphatase [Conexibacter sp.]